MKPDNKDSQFDPEKSSIFHACIVVAVGKDAMGEVRPCACDRNKYYVHGIENHYVRAADYDELLSLHRADQTLIASLREQLANSQNEYLAKETEAVEAMAKMREAISIAYKLLTTPMMEEVYRIAVALLLEDVLGKSEAPSE
jgi:hypothetical protein